MKERKFLTDGEEKNNKKDINFHKLEELEPYRHQNIIETSLLDEHT